MKIAINASILGKNSTGTGNAVINIIENFTHKENLDIYTAEVNSISSSYSVIEISHRTRPSYNGLSGLYRFFWNQYNLTKIGRNYDLVYCPTTHGSVFLKNQIITVLDLIVYQFPKIHPFQWLYYKLFLPIFLKRSKAIIVISDSVKVDLINSYVDLDSSKVIVVKCGFDEKMFNPNIDLVLYESIKFKYHITKEYFIAVGATFAHKNLEIIIKAFYERLNNNGLDFLLIVAGGATKYRKKLEDLVEKLKLSPYIKFVGYVPNEHLASLYQNSLGLIYSSLSEGFGLPLIEAMACGCPVIASKIDVLQEVGSDAVLYFDPLSSESLNNSITTLLSNKSERSNLISEGMVRVKEFSWKKAAAEIYEVFERCI